MAASPSDRFFDDRFTLREVADSERVFDGDGRAVALEALGGEIDQPFASGGRKPWRIWGAMVAVVRLPNVPKTSATRSVSPIKSEITHGGERTPRPRLA